MGEGFKGHGMGSAGAGYADDDDDKSHHPKLHKSHTTKHKIKDETDIKKEADSIVDEMTQHKADKKASEEKAAKQHEEEEAEASKPRRRVSQHGDTTKVSRHVNIEKVKAAPAVHVKMVVQGSFDDLS